MSGDRDRRRRPRSAISPRRKSLQIRDYIDRNLKVEGDLRREVGAGHQAQDRDRLLPGHPAPSRSLPVRGQRTHTNARTRKGRRRRSPARRRSGRSREVGRMAAAQGAEDRSAARRRRTSARAGPHQVDVQQHDRHDHRPAGEHARLGERRATSASRAPASPPRSPRSSPPRRPPRAAQEHGLQQVDVFVKGPGSGRETAIRSLAARRASRSPGSKT